MNLALFEFDGAVTTRDGYPGFLPYGSPRWRVVVGWLVLAVPYLLLQRGLFLAGRDAPLRRVRDVRRRAARPRRMTGFFAKENCAHGAKLRRLAQVLSLRDDALVYADGDTAADRAMLDAAHRRWYRWQEEAPMAAAA